MTTVRDSNAFDGVHLIPVTRHRQIASALEPELRGPGVGGGPQVVADHGAGWLAPPAAVFCASARLRVCAPARTVQKVMFFAVGTNMDGDHLRRWVPSARRLTIASLTGFTLSWHKRSSGGGKLTPLRTGDPTDVVWGVVYEVDGVGGTQIDEGQRAAGYQDESVTVATPEGMEHDVSVYVAGADMIDDSTMPMRSYRDPIVVAAASNGLPAEYVDGLARTPVADP